ncbi:MAG: hypothetical protein J7M25_08935 [Deltaproteobacteria bacterium]|nr:hypothetical protein [Deltaproteobacteria bacterium]
MTSLILILTLTIPTRPAGSLPLHRGNTLCKQGRFEQGLEQIFRAVITVEQVPAKVPASKWRPAARRCLLGWIRSLSHCRADRSVVKQLDDLKRVEERANKISMPDVARKARTRRSACLKRLPGLVQKRCRRQAGPDSTAVARTLHKTLASQTVLSKAAWSSSLGTCLDSWHKSIQIRCRAQPTLDILKEAGRLVTSSPKTFKPRAEHLYESCAQALGKRGWHMCLNRRFKQGRSLLVEALGRYNFYNAKDLHTFRRMRLEMLPDCGHFRLTFTGKTAVQTGALNATLRLDGSMILGGQSKLQGVFELRARTISAHAKGATSVLITQDRPCRIFVKGRYNPKTGNVAWWPDRIPAKMCHETIQVTKRGKTASLFKETLIWSLIQKTKLMKSWMAAQNHSSLKVRFSSPLPGNRSADMHARWTIETYRK